MLDLVVFAPLLHELDRFVPRQDEGLDGQVFLADLLHLGLNAGQILVGQLGIAEIDVIVKAVLGRRAEGKIRLRVQPLDGLRHNVGRRMAQHMQFLVLRALGNGAVFVDDFHGNLLVLLVENKKRSTPPVLRGEAKGSTVPPGLGSASKNAAPLNGGCNGPARRGFAPALCGGKAGCGPRPLAAPYLAVRAALSAGRGSAGLSASTLLRDVGFTIHRRKTKVKSPAGVAGGCFRPPRFKNL